MLLQRSFRPIVALAELHFAFELSLNLISCSSGSLHSILFGNFLFWCFLLLQVPQLILDELDTSFEVGPDIELFVFLYEKMVRNDINFSELFVVVELGLIGEIEVLDFVLVMRVGG